MNLLLPVEKPALTLDSSRALRLASKVPFAKYFLNRLLEISDESRVSITTDIQDKISPGLAAAVTKARSLSVDLYLDRNPLAKDVDELVETLVGINQLIDQLALKHMGPKKKITDLLSAMAELARITACHHHIHCHFQQIGPAPQLSAAQISHFYRLASDTVSLARRRGATMILIRLEALSGWVNLDVIDNSTASKEQIHEALEILSFRGTLIDARLRMSILPDGRCSTHCQLNER